VAASEWVDTGQSGLYEIRKHNCIKMKENLGKAVRKLSRSVATLDLRENPKSTVCT